MFASICRVMIVVSQLRTHAAKTGSTTLVETGAVALLLTALAAAVYGSHAIHGGFLSDAWGIRAHYEFAPNSGLLGGIENYLRAPNVIPRPLQAVYFSAQNALFGPHTGFWLAWQGALGVLMSASLYVLLRQLGFARGHAGVVSALVLIFPAATSIRLWIAPVSHLTIALALLGFTIALRAFGTAGRRRFGLHGLSILMFVASLLLYELMLPLMLASALCYRLRVPWAPALKRWLVDCVVLLPLVFTVTRSEDSSWEAQTVGGMWDHALVFWDQAQTLFATVVLPFGTEDWYVFALVAVVPAAALILLRQLDAGDPARADLLRWLGAIAGGLVVVTLGYTIYVPAMDYYAPLGPGVANRVNAVPSIGWVLVLYGLIALAATMAFRGLPSARGWALATALACSVFVGVGWLEAVQRDSRAFTQAYAEGQRVLRTVRAAMPTTPPSSTIWTFGQPAELRPGVPVFSNTWDMTSSIRLLYGDPTLDSYVGLAGTTFDCRRDRLVPGGPYAGDAQPGSFGSRYGRTYFVDTTTGRWERIDSRAQCRSAASSFPRSPALATT